MAGRTVREQSKTLALILLVLFILLWSQIEYFAPYVFADYQSQQLDSFVGIEWGRTKEDVLEIMQSGRTGPEFTVREESIELPDGRLGSRLVIPDRELIEKKTDVVFVFSPDERLIKGVLRFHLTDQKHCVKAIDTISRTISKQYSSFVRSERTVNKGNLPFCNALILNRAHKHIRWRASATNSTIILSIGLESKDMVRVSFEPHDFFRTYRSGWKDLFADFFPWSNH